MKKHVRTKLTANHQIQPYLFYQEMHGIIPSSFGCGSIEKDVFMEKMAATNLQDGDSIKYESYSFRDKKFLLMDYFIPTKGKTAIYYCVGHTEIPSGWQILYSSKSDAKIVEQLKTVMLSCVEEEEEGSLAVIVTDGINLRTHSFQPELSEKVIDIEKQYNSDFTKVSEHIIEKLQSDDKGVVLLHGNPGTGKTSYLRYLVSKVKKEFIILPVEMVRTLSSPTLLSHLMNHENCVLVLEDAEQAIKSRDMGDDNAVSTLLNISDGLLSDLLNIQVICTFNTNLNNIDSALLRKGRVIARYEFKPLEMEKANEMLKHIGSDYITSNPMTLAEIYNVKEKSWQQEKVRVGFN